MSTLVTKKADMVVINAKEKKIEAISDHPGLDTLRGIVGGSIAFAHTFENGDTLYVNDEGLLDDSIDYGFIIEGGHQPFAGNGVIVGQEVEDFENDTYEIKDAKTKMVTVKFITKKEIYEALHQY